MNIRAVILAGGEGTRLRVLTAKRTKPAVPFAGKYRIIDFPLSNCVNSRIFDVMIVAQYRPHSLIEHIGAGGPWDLNRDFTGGVRILTPYRALGSSWFVGTADAVQQNFTFIKHGNPDAVLMLSGDHIYSMNYEPLIRYHQERQADITVAVINVPYADASRFGIVGVDENNNITSFVEKPAVPPSTLANMGIYIFNMDVLNLSLWEDHLNQESSHDFGKNILPTLIESGKKVVAYPYDGYWMDVGTVQSYWQAHMDLLCEPPAFNLYNPKWVIHTRTEERPPARIHSGAVVEDSLICDGCSIESGARVVRSILSPGVTVRAGTTVEESIILTHTTISNDCRVIRSVLDKRIHVGEGVQIGGRVDPDLKIAMVGRNSKVPAGAILHPGGTVGWDVISSDYASLEIHESDFVQPRRLPFEI
ncbi:MAG TPA: glucose-1-phosphate adenylyltransferase [Anaerolineaceae bacterium]|nr:MAG: glucose-1-phosphate adenylyltransferase [Chloroflexi bacterium GWB2_54_36]HAL17654.1 glucose-1-phosphate adenylyltransferase [Anaerolineaceae bacterium]HBA90230.1 glucose-1-phosphate adenylyltransferase [Anaerolineaceae bacterium]